MTLLPPHPGDLLSAWLDDELTPAEASEVAAHLEGCPACAAERDEVEASRTALRALPRLDVPEGLLRPLPAVHVGDLISALLDHELEADLVPGIEAHLAACPACTAEHDEVAWARTALRRLPPVEPPEGALRLGPAWPRPPVAVRPRRGGGAGGFRPPPARRLGPRQVVAASAAVAAAGFGVLGLVGRSAPADTSKPAVATFVADHSTSSPGPDAVSGLAPVAVPVSFSR
jgi:anti-sigma factor RsiW